MKLSSLFGLKSRLRRMRILAGEGALALEDRVQLLKFALADERDRLQGIVLLLVAITGLSTVAVALLSVALVVQFWDTPYRNTVAWLLAALWVGLWAVAVVLLAKTLRRSSDSFEPARETLARDMAWFHATFASEHPAQKVQREAAPPADRAEVLARIERQRMRIATLQAAENHVGEVPREPETASAKAVRIAREHPIATGMATSAVLAVLGPKRVVRWASTLLPLLWRMR